MGSSKSFIGNEVVAEKWKENFRMPKESFMVFCDELRAYIQKKDNQFRKAVPVDTQVAEHFFI